MHGAREVSAIVRKLPPPNSFLRPSLQAAGLDPDNLPERAAGPDVENRGNAWKDISSAGHGVGSVRDVPTTAELCERLIRDYRAAVARVASDPFAARQ